MSQPLAALGQVRVGARPAGVALHVVEIARGQSARDGPENDGDTEVRVPPLEPAVQVVDSWPSCLVWLPATRGHLVRHLHRDHRPAAVKVGAGDRERDDPVHWRASDAASDWSRSTASRSRPTTLRETRLVAHLARQQTQTGPRAQRWHGNAVWHFHCPAQTPTCSAPAACSHSRERARRSKVQRGFTSPLAK